MKLIAILVLHLFLLTGCTISFSNMDTHGTASDLLDENQSATPTISPTLTVPIKPM